LDTLAQSETEDDNKQNSRYVHDTF
jgi:hypothetical protein